MSNSSAMTTLESSSLQHAEQRTLHVNLGDLLVEDLLHVQVGGIAVLTSTPSGYASSWLEIPVPKRADFTIKSGYILLTPEPSPVPGLPGTRAVLRLRIDWCGRCLSGSRASRYRAISFVWWPPRGASS